MIQIENEIPRILIADDDPDELFVTSRVLTRAGFEVDQADSGKETISKAVRFKPHLLLLDVVMPEMDGFEVCRQIKSNPLHDDMSIVFVSNFSNSPATKSRGLDAGADDFIERPFHNEEFLSRINSILRVRAAEQRLKAQQQWMQVTLSSIGDGLVTCDRQEQIVFMNPVAEALSGWTLDEAKGETFHQVFPLIDEDSGRPVPNPLARALKDNAVQRLTGNISLIRKNGSPLSISDSAAPIRMGDREIIGGVMVFQDISDKKQAEMALSSAMENWEALFRAIGQVTLITDADHTILEVNDIAEKKLDLARKDIIGRKCYELMHGCDTPHDGCPMQKALQLKKQASASLPIQRLNGEYLISCTPVLDPDQTVEKIIHISTDISEIKRIEQDRKRLEEHLRQAQKLEAIGTLAGGIAHDFNNILTSILGYAELSLEEAGHNHRLADNLQEIYSAGKRAKDLVRQILTFARQTKEKKETVQVGPIVKEVLKFIRSSAPATIEVVHHISTDAAVQMDPTRLHQVLMNLCTNAVQAMEDTGGRLQVDIDLIHYTPQACPGLHLSEPGEYVKCSVSDTGYGIPEEIRDNIFEPYFTTKTAREGTGLGLATVHGIVRDCHGHIECQSDPEKGTVFFLYLPRSESRHQPSDASTEMPRGTEHVLIVDDEPAIAKLEYRMLSNLGYRVTTKTDSQEALDAVRQAPDSFDLVITDMTMPHMTGDKLAVEIKKIKPEIPVMLCTGYSKKISPETIDEMGIDALFFKPVLHQKIAVSVRNILDATKADSRG